MNVNAQWRELGVQTHTHTRACALTHTHAHTGSCNYMHTPLCFYRVCSQSEKMAYTNTNTLTYPFTNTHTHTIGSTLAEGHTQSCTG